MLTSSIFQKRFSRWMTLVMITFSSFAMFVPDDALLMGMPAATSMLLNNDRFEVSVNWRNYNNGQTGPGTAIKLTSDSGYFFFFNAANIELVIKVLDGRSVNGYFWVMYGALSDVEYNIMIRDMYTGASKDYYNPAHNLASVSDVTAFTGQSTSWTAGQLYAVDSIVGNLR